MSKKYDPTLASALHRALRHSEGTPEDHRRILQLARKLELSDPVLSPSPPAQRFATLQREVHFHATHPATQTWLWAHGFPKTGSFSENFISPVVLHVPARGLELATSYPKAFRTALVEYILGYPFWANPFTPEYIPFLATVPVTALCTRWDHFQVFNQRTDAYITTTEIRNIVLMTHHIPALSTTHWYAVTQAYLTEHFTLHEIAAMLLEASPSNSNPT